MQVNHTYIIQEISAPQGYLIAHPIEFVVKDTLSIQHFYMYDELKTILQTGDQTYLIGYVLAFLTTLIVIIGHLYFVRKKIND